MFNGNLFSDGDHLKMHAIMHPQGTSKLERENDFFFWRQINLMSIFYFINDSNNILLDGHLSKVIKQINRTVCHYMIWHACLLNRKNVFYLNRRSKVDLAFLFLFLFFLQTFIN